MTALEIGTHVRLGEPVDRYPHFLAPAGATGVVVHVDDEVVRVKLDEPLAGAEEWENEIHWYAGYGDDEALEALEVIG